VSEIRFVADQHDGDLVVSIRQFPHFFQPAREMAEGLPPVRQKMQRKRSARR
jgi:hypothetical protein